MIVVDRTEDQLHVLAESHVEHAICFVEDCDLDVGGVERLAAEVVKKSARSAHDQMDSVLQGPELAVDGRSSVNRDGMETGKIGAEAVHFLADLDCEFPGGRENEDLRDMVVEIDLGERREHKGRGLAGAGFGESDEIFPGEGRWNRKGLDRGGFLEVEGFHRFEKGSGEAEFAEGRNIHRGGTRAGSRRGREDGREFPRHKTQDTSDVT